MSSLLKILSVLSASAGVIWLNANSVGITIENLAGNFGLSDYLQAVNKPLQVFYARLSEFDQSALIVQYGPWGLTVGGAFLFVLIVIWQFFSGANKNRVPDKLAQACEELAVEISEFLNDRQLLEPQHSSEDLTDITEEQLDTQFEEEANFTNETKVLYEEKIIPKLNDLHSILVKNKHRPSDILALGDDSWANRNIGRLTSYARKLRLGEKIIDDRQVQDGIIEQVGSV